MCSFSYLFIDNHLEWTKKLKESAAMREVAPHPLTLLLGEKESENADSSFSCCFRELFLRSRAFEFSLYALVEEYPQGYEDIAQQFLSACLMPSVNSNLLIKVLHGLSYSTLSPTAHKTIVKVIATFRNYKFTQHSDGLRQNLRTISSYTSRLSIARNSVSTAISGDPKIFIARSLHTLGLGGDLMNSYLCVQRILKEQRDYLANAMATLESQAFTDLTTLMVELKLTLNEDEQREKETCKGEDFIPSRILQAGVVQRNELDELETQRTKLLARLRKVQEKITYTKDTITELDTKMANTKTRYEKDFAAHEKEMECEREELSKSKGQSSAHQFRKFVQEDHKGVVEEMKRDAGNITAHLRSIEPALAKNLTNYIDLQIAFLSHLKETLGDPGTTEEEKVKYQESISQIEMSSHSFGEILSVLEQQRTGLFFLFCFYFVKCCRNELYGVDW